MTTRSARSERSVRGYCSNEASPAFVGVQTVNKELSGESGGEASGVTQSPIIKLESLTLNTRNKINVWQ